MGSGGDVEAPGDGSSGDEKAPESSDSEDDGSGSAHDEVKEPERRSGKARGAADRVTEVPDFVAIPVVKFHLRKEAATQAAYQVVIALYVQQAFHGKIGEIQDIKGFVALASDIVFAAFYLGAAATITGAYYCWDEITRKQRMPYVHPSVFSDGWLSYVPHDVPKVFGSQIPVLCVVMGVFWGITAGARAASRAPGPAAGRADRAPAARAGGGFVVFVALVWVARSGAGAAASRCGAGHAPGGYAMLFVAFVHGSSEIPPAVLTAYEESTFGSQLALSAHGRDQKLLHKRRRARPRAGRAAAAPPRARSRRRRRGSRADGSGPLAGVPTPGGAPRPRRPTPPQAELVHGDETVTEMVDTPYEVAKCAYFYRGPGLAMADVAGIRTMALEICGTTFLSAALLTLASTLRGAASVPRAPARGARRGPRDRPGANRRLYVEIGRGALPFLNPVVFKKGILRTFPVHFGGEGAPKQLRRLLTNCLWWTGVFGGSAVGPARRRRRRR
ncbi:hypothetical protein JL720_5931 [Aureococcus anophagefferens]|nr:hypothetical protein JL720_5931 [Aureococcus anophagefferens]